MAPPSWTGNRFDIDWPYPSYYRMGRVLGRGVNSIVYLGKPRWGNGDMERALKSVQILGEEQLSEELLEEEEMLRRCSGLNVVRCHGYEIARDAFDLNKKNHNLILEYARGGTLKYKILRRRGLRVSQVREVAKDILQGLETIHGNNVVHLDINPTNILQVSVCDGFREYKHLSIIADFGSALDADAEQPYGHRLAHRSRDRRYRAPELFMNSPINFAVDIWAFGCTVLEMLTGEPPLKQDNGVPYIPDWYCDDTKDFLGNCFNLNADERWTSHALLNHPFLIIPDDVDDIDEVGDGL